MLSPFTNSKEQQPGEAKDPRGARFQCLRCSCEFKPEEPRLGLENEEGWKPLFQNPGTSCAFDLPAHTAPRCRKGVSERSAEGAPGKRALGEWQQLLATRRNTTACLLC